MGASRTTAAGGGILAARRRRNIRATALLGLLVGLVVGAGVLGALAARSHEVLAEGKILPYTNGNVYRVRLFDSFNVYLEPEVTPSTDVVNATSLVVIASLSALAFVLVSRYGAPGQNRLRWFLGLASACGLFLAADELFGVHESVGHNLQFLADVPGVVHPDDVVIAGYLVLAAVFVVAFRDVLSASRSALALVASSFAAFVAAALMDIVDVPYEEYVESLSALLALAGFAVLTVHHLGRALRLAPRS